MPLAMLVSQQAARHVPFVAARTHSPSTAFLAVLRSSTKTFCTAKKNNILSMGHHTKYRQGTCALFSGIPGFDSYNNDDNSGEKDLPKGATGWNHNLPSESSDFWNIEPNGSGQEKTDSNNNSNTGATPDNEQEELRTGWLHNTEPTPRAKAIDQQEKKQSNKARQRLQLAMKEQEQNHRMVSPPAFHACGENRCLVVTEHLLSVPLDRKIPRSTRMDLFFTIVEKVTNDNEAWLKGLASMNPNQRAKEYIQRSGFLDADKMILYLQGGPGFGSPTPVASLGFSPGSSWAASALDNYNRVVLMDQRGTGRSTAITKQTLQQKFPDLFLLDGLDDTGVKVLQDFDSSHPEEAARVQAAVKETTEDMTHFRANNIVLDAEDLKDALMVPTEEPVTEPRPWGCALGQSFGGFCIMTYLSQIDNPPRICLLTGGIAPMLTPVLDAYTALWGRVKERSLQYYEMYPGDVAVVKTIVQKLLKEAAELPSGGTLTARRFLQLGLALGGSPTAFASFHAMLSTAMVNSDGSDSDFTRAFLKYVDSAQNFDDHPIYFWLHESIYGDGPQMNSPTNWAAHNAYEALAASNKEYDYKYTSSSNDSNLPTLFFGEMVFPWMPKDFADVSGVGLQAVANSLAAKTDWPPLYDGDHMRKVLGDGTCKAAAAVYYDDMYVDFDACMKVTARGGPLQGCKVWVTNEYQHSGLRDGGSEIFSKLYGMATGGIRTPS